MAGRVGRPHGLDGSFYVSDARRALLAVGTRVTLAGREEQIVALRGAEQRPIIRLGGCANRSRAERLRGEPLLVSTGSRPELAPGEWWADELEGCRVYDGDRAVGIVRAMVELPSCECLEVERLDGDGELLIPMVSDAIRRVDVDARAIDVDLAFLGEGA